MSGAYPDSFDTIGLAIDARGVCRVTLARPDVLNAFDETMIAELTAVFEAAASDADVRVVLLAAEGKAFCAGADLRWMQRAAANTHADNLADARRFAHMMAVMNTCPKPVVVRVQGAAYGGGVGLCCAADIVVAAASAKFAVSEARFGILPAVIGPYLNNAVGKRHARRLALTGELIDADLAMHMGLVQHVADAEALDAMVEKVVASLLVNGPTALAEIKGLFAGFEVGPVTQEVAETTAQTIARVRSGTEAKEGFAAFFAKRPAGWVPGQN